MTDIVERLRIERVLIGEGVKLLCLEAADEIERLQRLVDDKERKLVLQEAREALSISKLRTLSAIHGTDCSDLLAERAELRPDEMEKRIKGGR